MPYAGAFATRLAAHIDVTLLCADAAPGHPDSRAKSVESNFVYHGSFSEYKWIHFFQSPVTQMVLRSAQGWCRLHGPADAKGIPFYPELYFYHLAVPTAS